MSVLEQNKRNPKKYNLLQMPETTVYTLILKVTNFMRIFSALLGLFFLLCPIVTAAQDKTFISVPVSVSDREGRYIPNLKKDDFTILQDGKEQKISFFATEDEQVSVALLLDTSESTKSVLPEIREAAKDFIKLLNPNDRALVATFDAEVKILQPFTSDHDSLEKSLDNLQTAESEGTVVFSAVDQVLQKSFSNAPGRKVVVLLSDGKDYGSRVSKKDLFDRLEESDVLIYSVFYQTGQVRVDDKGEVKTEKEKPKKEKKPKKKKGYSIKITLPREPITADEIKLADQVASTEAVSVLQEMSDTTAGRFYMSDAPNLRRIFKQISAELRQQYRLGFYTRDGETNEEINNIIVKVNRAEAVVHARGKYRAKKL